MRPGPLRWRNVLVVAQIAMSLVLLVGAGLFLRSWQQMLAVDPGFGRCSDVGPVRHDAGHAVDPDDAVQRTRRLLERFRALPGVDSRRTRLATAARVRRPASPTSRSTVACRPRAGRPSAPTEQPWTAVSSTPPA